MDEPEFEGDKRAATAVSTLRSKGLRVASDLAFEPLSGPYESTDPFATRLIEEMNRTPPSAAAEPARAAQNDDPFETRVFKAPILGPVTPTAPDPFNTIVHPPTGPSRDDQRADAMLHDRAALSAEIASRLRAIEDQVRTNPGSVDLTRIEAVVAEATTVLAGAGKDLAAVAARPTATPAARTSSAASPRARAALATSGRLRSSAALHATAAATTAASAPAVDPRIAWAAGNTNSR
ncbi:hypothetical protein [Kitasatospora sp. NRRL B-11411]|uniref:hypothetical protein n=1 Tax=Kitasatospora sp. NRRL B-11411 TaxID=1463822 RepID=UPI0004C323B1|nr:hypothetical protein [Kitasatospora sp. NRRL B-11411]